MKHLLLLSTVFLLMLSSCRDDDSCSDPTNPECNNYDPCYYSEMPTADFTIEEVFRNPSYSYYYSSIKDSAFGRWMRFSAGSNNNPTIQHTWYLGTEIINDSSFTRDFYDVAYRPVDVTISHVIEYDSDPTCYPDSPEKDSVSRTFTLVRYYEDMPIFGKFRVVNTNSPADSFNIEIGVYGVNSFQDSLHPTPINSTDQYNEGIMGADVYCVNLLNLGEASPINGMFVFNAGGFDVYSYTSKYKNGVFKLSSDYKSLYFNCINTHTDQTYSIIGKRVKQ